MEAEVQMATKLAEELPFKALAFASSLVSKLGSPSPSPFSWSAILYVQRTAGGAAASTLFETSSISAVSSPVSDSSFHIIYLYI